MRRWPVRAATGAVDRSRGLMQWSVRPPARERPRATRESSIAPMRESGLEDTEAIADLTLGSVDVLPAGELERRLARGKPLRVKLGIDPTAPDIHLGHVVVLEKLRQFQAAGHVAYDHRRLHGPGRRSRAAARRCGRCSPTRRSTPTPGPSRSRPSRSSTADLTEVRFNSEWLDMPSAELFGLAARFTVARLLERDDFSNRMAAAEPISLLELLYPVLQGYDSVAVERRRRARWDGAEVQPALRPRRPDAPSARSRRS